MALYKISDRTPAAAAGAPFALLRPGTPRAFIREISFSLVAATATSIGIIRSATLGTASTSKLGQAIDPADAASATNLDTAWSAAPTIAGSPIYLERWDLPAAIGAGLIKRFERGELIATGAAAGGILIWNPGAGAGSIMNVNIVYEE